MIKTQQLRLRREPIKTRSTRSEHSQGGAQQSEQYLYYAQRETQSRCDSSKANTRQANCFKDK
jgi:hypothetical protein